MGHFFPLAEAADSMLCYGRLCARHLGLDLRHFPAAHAIIAGLLLVTSFLLHYTAVYYLLHPCKKLFGRVTAAVGLSISYLVFVTCFIPWHPYWIRELHVMVACMFAWKSMELALLRRDEVLPPLPNFLLDDALVLRPDVLRDPRVRRAKELAAQVPFKERLKVALPQVGWCFVQYVGVEATNTILMHQPHNFLALPVWRQFILNVLFAECLYLHLSYFFSAMCVVNVLFFSDAVEAWPPPFNKPFAATSPIDFWNRRWHGMFKWYFVQLVYRPTQAVIHKAGKPSPLAKTLPTFAVFLVSGLFHEALLYINFGACTGEQLAFFLLHAVVLVAQRYLERAAQSIAHKRGQGMLQAGSVSSSYGTLPAQAAKDVPSQLEEQGQGATAGQVSGQPLRVHIVAKSTAVGSESTTEASEEHEGSGDDGSCCGSSGSAEVLKRGLQPGVTAVVRRANGHISKDAGGSQAQDACGGSEEDHDVNGAAGGHDDVALKGSKGCSEGQKGVAGVNGGTAASAPGVSRKRSGVRRDLWSQTLLLLMGVERETPTVQFVRYVVLLLVYNLFLGLTLSLFFAPWFRFGYHRELRVFVPGQVHDVVQHLVSKWGLGTVLEAVQAA